MRFETFLGASDRNIQILKGTHQEKGTYPSLTPTVHPPGGRGGNILTCRFINMCMNAFKRQCAGCEESTSVIILNLALANHAFYVARIKFYRFWNTLFNLQLNISDMWNHKVFYISAPIHQYSYVLSFVAVRIWAVVGHSTARPWPINCSAVVPPFTWQQRLCVGTSAKFRDFSLPT